MNDEEDIYDLVLARFRDGKIAGTTDWLKRELAKETRDRFLGLVDSDFTNDPASLADSINNFAASCRSSFDLRSIYLEMNGFDINPDEWYFDLFGYKDFGEDPEDLEWLCDWDSEHTPHVTLTGLEEVQADFEWYHGKWTYKDDKWDRTYELATNLVMSKFVELIGRAVETGRIQSGLIVLATAHDFDSLGIFYT